tara:strand:- start:698 stop:1057 length:360 start_codon:yes stop_codon:yes gene_type:complete
VSETIFSLSLALVIIGGVTYALIAVAKPNIPSKWRKATAAGRSTMLALPMLVGGILSVLSMGNLVGLVSGLTGGPPELPVSWGASFILGMFAGAFATQIHSAVRSRIKLAAEKAIAEEE